MSAFKVELAGEIELDIGGKIHKMKEPSSAYYEKYIAKSQEAQDDAQKALAFGRDFLEGLGFPKEYLGSITVKSLNALIEHITGNEKKS